MCFKASNWHLKCLCGVALLQTDFPQEAFAVEIKMLMCSLSLSPVFKKAVILVYREHNKLKKKMVSITSVVLVYLHVTQT